MTTEQKASAEEHEFPPDRFDEGCVKCGGYEGEPCEPPMTDKRIIDRIATEVMGWQDNGTGCWITAYKLIPSDKCVFHYMKHEFDPLRNWNHWRRVEEQITLTDPDEEGFDLYHEFILRFDEDIAVYMEAGLRTRCLALIKALDSMKSA